MYVISGFFSYKSYEDGNQESVKPVLLQVWNWALTLHHTRGVAVEGTSLKGWLLANSITMGWGLVYAKRLVCDQGIREAYVY